MRTKRFLSLLLVLTMLAAMLTVMPVFAQTGEPGSIEVTANDAMKSLDLTNLMSEEEKQNMRDGGEVTVNYTIEFVGSSIKNTAKYVDLVAGDEPTAVSNDPAENRYLRTRIYHHWPQLDMFIGNADNYAGSIDEYIDKANSIYKRVLNVGGGFTQDDNTYTYNTEIVIDNNAHTLTQVTNGFNGETALSGNKRGTEFTFAVSENVNKTKLKLVAWNNGNESERIAYSVKNITVSVAAPEPYLSLDKDFARIDGDDNVTITPTCTNFDAADLKWERGGNAMTMKSGEKGAITVSKGDAQPGDAETFTASYTNGETTLEASCTLVYVPNYGYTLYDDNGSAYMYLGNQSLSGGGGSLDFTKGQTDIKGNTLSISENFKFSNEGTATITLPEIDLSECDYNRVVVKVGVGDTYRNVTVKVGDTELGEIQNINTNNGWANYSDYGLYFDNNTASGNVVLDISKPQDANSYAGNYVYVKFLKGLDSEVIPKTEAHYQGTKANFKNGSDRSDSSTYKFVDGVSESTKLIFADENEPSAVASKFTEKYINTIGYNGSSLVKPTISNVSLAAGSYNIYYLGYNNQKTFYADISSEGLTETLTFSTKIDQGQTSGVDIASSNGEHTLKLYTIPITLSSDLTNGKIEFYVDIPDNTSNRNWLPDLYSVVIVRDIGFGEGFADSGRYSVNSGGAIYGVIRYLQEYTGAQPSEYGFYFIDNETGKIIQGEQITTTADMSEAGGFYGDLNAIPESSFGKYSAKAFVTVGGTTYFASSIGGEVTEASDMVVYPDTEDGE